MNFLKFDHPDTRWDVVAFRPLGTAGRTTTVLFTDGAFKRGDSFGAAEAEIVRDENDVVVRLVVDRSTILSGAAAIELYEDHFREAQASMDSRYIVPQPDVEVVFGDG